MFRHQPAIITRSIDSSDGPQDMTGPDPPENFSCKSEITSQGVELTWDKPSSGGPVFYYEIFKNDSFLARSSDTIHVHDSPSDGDVFKARSVGIRGLKSSFSGTCTYTGDESLDPAVVGMSHRTSLHLSWSDLRHTDQISLEGYNVYLDGVKQNSSLLGTNILEYGFFDLVVDQDYDVAVTFVHDGGQESGQFTVTGTPPGSTVVFQGITRNNNFGFTLVGLNNQPSHHWVGDVGLALKDKARVTVTPDWSFDRIYDYRTWSIPATHDYTFRLAPFEGEAKVDFEEGCSNGLSFVHNRLKPKSVIMGDDVRGIGLAIGESYNFRWSGYCENQPGTYLDISATVIISDSADIISQATFDDDNLGFFTELPQDTVTLDERPNSAAGEVIFYWVTFPSIPFYDLYIRSKGGSFPSSPQYEDLTRDDNILSDTSLAADTYEARMDFKRRDKTVMIQSNILEFTIS